MKPLSNPLSLVLSLILALPLLAALACQPAGPEGNEEPAAEPGKAGGKRAGARPAAAPGPVGYESWRRVLAQRVSEGTIDGVPVALVDYAALAESGQGLRRSLRSMATVDADGLPREDRIAFWINAYNAHAMSLVAKSWPVDSIRDVGGLLDKVWGKTVGVVAGEERTLDEIEKEILLPMADARVHMALNCASVSCPDLRKEPFTGAALERQLDEQARRFLASPEKGAAVAADGKTLRISRIFEWFEDDFAADGGVHAFLERYGPPKIAPLAAAGAPLEYLDYDWTANAKSKAE